jgi:cytochrome c5
MRKLLIASLTGASLFVSGLAFAQDTTPAAPAQPANAPATQPVAQPVAASSGDQITCQPVTHEGMVVGKECHTKKEWDRRRAETQRNLWQWQRNSDWGMVKN